MLAQPASQAHANSSSASCCAASRSILPEAINAAYWALMSIGIQEIEEDRMDRIYDLETLRSNVAGNMPWCLCVRIINRSEPISVFMTANMTGVPYQHVSTLLFS